MCYYSLNFDTIEGKRICYVFTRIKIGYLGDRGNKIGYYGDRGDNENIFICYVKIYIKIYIKK